MPAVDPLLREIPCRRIQRTQHEWSHEQLVASPLAYHAHNHARTLSSFVFFFTGFQAKERLLAVYSVARGRLAEGSLRKA